MGFLEDQRRIEQQRAKQLLANRKKRLRAAKGSDSAQRAEHRFAQQAEVARYRRLANAQSMDAVKEISPDGGYWLLDVTAKTHTKGCVAPETVVSGGAHTKSCSIRPYSGQLVSVVVASGQQLSVTPNHPVLTTIGWVAANRLRPGDHVLSSYYGQGNFWGPDNDGETPAPIEDVFHSLKEASPFARTGDAVGSMDFHGDGFPGEVNTVFADGLLSGCGDAGVGDPISEDDLFFGDPVVRAGFAPQSCQSMPFFASGAPSIQLPPFVQRVNDLGLGGWVDRSPPSGLALIEAADVNTILDKNPAHRFPGDAKCFSELLGRLAGLVFPDEVVSINFDSFHGSVLNLETDENWYCANGIIVHNCLKLAGFNWPWHVLDRVHPLRHHGCRCAILPASDTANWGDGRVARHVLMEGEPVVVHDDQQLGSWFTNAGETRWR